MNSENFDGPTTASSVGNLDFAALSNLSIYHATLTIMDITKFIVSHRENALLVGDYASYRKQLSRRLLVVRKKLYYTSIKSKKYVARPAVTAEEVAQNHEYVDT